MIHPSEDVLLLYALDMVVFERMPDGSLGSASRLPAWFERICPQTGSHQNQHELLSVAPFLEAFLPDAEDLWASSRGRLYAGHWVQRDMDGIDRNLEAWALNAGARRFLVLRLLGAEFEETRRALQTVRTSNLANELNPAVRESELRLAGGLGYVRLCLGIACLAVPALFTLQGFGLWKFHLADSLMNWVGLAGLASIIGLLLAKGSERTGGD